MLVVAVAAGSGAAPTSAPPTSGPPSAGPPPSGSAPRSPAPVSIPTGRTTTLIARVDAGAPIELAFPSEAYARAAAADVDGRWDQARALYRQAADAWSLTARAEPSPALELAIAKAEAEATASQMLGIYARREALAAGGSAPELGRDRASDEARLLRAKLMATRAVLGVVPPALYARARDQLRAALAADARGPGNRAGRAELEMLLCATYAVGGQLAAALLAQAQVPRAERDDPANLVAVAACAAALGENAAALSTLEAFVLMPISPRPERVLREVYLSNDWDHLRGAPRFESLFR